MSLKTLIATLGKESGTQPSKGDRDKMIEGFIKINKKIGDKVFNKSTSQITWDNLISDANEFDVDMSGFVNLLLEEYELSSTNLVPITLTTKLAEFTNTMDHLRKTYQLYQELISSLRVVMAKPSDKRTLADEAYMKNFPEYKKKFKMVENKMKQSIKLFKKMIKQTIMDVSKSYEDNLSGDPMAEMLLSSITSKGSPFEKKKV